MNKIETKILNCSAIREAEKNMVFTARLTQRGHLIHNMEDLVRLYNSSFTNDTVRNMGSLPHPTIQKLRDHSGSSRCKPEISFPDYPASE